MRVSPSDKALLITISGASFLVLIFFFLGVKPYQNDLTEEFIEIPVISESIFEEELPEIAQLHELSNIRSNQAYNSSALEKETKSFEEEDEIRKAIEARQNQSVSDLDADNESRLKEMREEQSEMFSRNIEETKAAIEAREKERNAKKQSKYKQSTVSYNLVDRTAMQLPNPVYTCDALGTVVINITVNKAGSITKKTFNSASSSSSNGCLIEQAMLYLERAYFDAGKKEQQLGSVTFIFQG